MILHRVDNEIIHSCSLVQLIGICAFTLCGRALRKTADWKFNHFLKSLLTRSDKPTNVTALKLKYCWKWFSFRTSLKKLKFAIEMTIQNQMLDHFFQFGRWNKKIRERHSCKKWLAVSFVVRSLILSLLLAKMCRFSHNAVQIVTMINDEVQRNVWAQSA